ncbi:hypothetical protein, partial [Candidatus Chloroploca asiatica]|uniref:hypothetical protein n=1 Tax=Candidatus Chloroploca asiatica TaxID=1506545 RepID=UPI001C0EC0FE
PSSSYRKGVHMVSVAAAGSDFASALSHSLTQGRAECDTIIAYKINQRCCVVAGLFVVLCCIGAPGWCVCLKKQ